MLWDAISLIDDATIEAVNALGGIATITMSHPHMFGSMVAWSHAFGNAPIELHASLESWVMRTDPVIEYWDSKTHEIGAGLTLIRCDGHFAGSTALYWAAGGEGQGALLSCDTLFVTKDRRHVTFMYSIPNYIPLSASQVDRIVAAVEPYSYDRVYSQFDGREIRSGGKEAVQRSAARYKAAIDTP